MFRWRVSGRAASLEIPSLFLSPFNRKSYSQGPKVAVAILRASWETAAR